MSNTESVNLNINVQLQSLRKAVSELTKVQNIVKNININNNKTYTGDTTKNYYRGLTQNLKAETIDLVDARGNIIKSITKDAPSVAPNLIADQSKAMKDFEKNAQKQFAEADKLIKQTSVMQEQELVKQRKRKEQFYDVDTKMAKAQIATVEEARRKAWGDSAKMAFSLHIAQTYIQPFITAIKAMVQESITVFAEFEKYYADYVAKSADFKDVMSRSDIFESAVSQTYSINEMADAMERFAASGIDITQNQQALTDVLQLATTANISYDEAANSVIKTQEAFKLSIQDSTMIVDALTNSANSSTAELKDLTEWFGYASGMAQETGISVQQLAAYLGILSSTGMKSAGTAMRQMLVQMTDNNVREKLDAVFGQKFDYMQMDETLLKMREFVQSSGNQAEVMQRISNALGGKVNAREALSRLLTADDATWSRIMTATERSGTAAQLFDTMTNNASANIQRIKNNILIIVAQVGEIFAPLIKLILVVTDVLARITNNIPKSIKMVIGGLVLLASTVAILLSGFASLVGLYYVLHAANLEFTGENLAASFSIKKFAMELTKLSATLVRHITLTNEATASQVVMNKTLNDGARTGIGGMSKYMLAGIGVMVSYMGYQYAMEQQSYGLAAALNLVTAALSGIMVGGMIGGPLGAVLGGAVGFGVGYMGQSQIDRAKEDSTLAHRESAWYKKTDVTQYVDKGAKNYFTISNVNLSGVSDPTGLATGLLYESDKV